MQGFPQVGDIIDGMYEVRQQIGQGGFGAVLLAKHLSMERDVALKLLVVPPGANHAEMIERFRREVMAIRNLSHPNTVKIYDYRDSEQGLLYYTMEYLRGITLKDLAKHEGPQSPRRVKHIIRQVLKSLAEAHSSGIIHRDLKPANIMLVEMHGETDFVKVLDFGIAKLLDQNESEEDPLTSAGVLVGTLRYMAPEQITGKPLGAYTDLYSLGLVAVELLTGQSVFAGTGRWDVLQKQISDDPVDVPVHLALDPIHRILMRALSKDIEGRYQNALEMLKALDAIPDSELRDTPLTADSIAPGAPLPLLNVEPLPEGYDDVEKTEMAASPLEAKPGLVPPRPLLTPTPMMTPTPAPRATPFDTFNSPALADEPIAASGGGKKAAMVAIPLIVIVVVAVGLGLGPLSSAKNSDASSGGADKVAANTLTPPADKPVVEEPTPEPDDAPVAEKPEDKPVEEPPPPTGPQIVELVSTSSPAKVYRGAQFLGTTPYKIIVGDGQSLRLVADGFEPQDIKLDKASPGKLEVALVKLPEEKPATRPTNTTTARPNTTTRQPPADKKPPAADDWVDIKPKPSSKPKKAPDVPIF